MQKMPKFAKLQSLLARRTRAGAGNPLWSFLNSAFGLWLLSAMLVTVAGSLISKQHDCLVTARTNLETFWNLSLEIRDRRHRLFLAILNSSNPQDFMKATKSNVYAIFKEYDGQTLPALAAKQTRLRAKINYLDSGRWLGYQKQYFEKFPHSMSLFTLMEGGAIYDEIDETLWQRFRQSQHHVATFYDAILTHDVGANFRPHCSPWTVFRGLITDGEHTIT